MAGVTGHTKAQHAYPGALLQAHESTIPGRRVWDVAQDHHGSTAAYPDSNHVCVQVQIFPIARVPSAAEQLMSWHWTLISDGIRACKWERLV